MLDIYVGKNGDKRYLDVTAYNDSEFDYSYPILYKWFNEIRSLINDNGSMLNFKSAHKSMFIG